MNIDLKQSITKFAINPRNVNQVVCCANQYLKYLLVNLTNKLVKENNPNMVPMRIEKANNFISQNYQKCD